VLAQFGEAVQRAGATGGPSAGQAGPGEPSSRPGDDNVVDAEFEDVDDSRRRQG
jgi:hypothetical protein